MYLFPYLCLVSLSLYVYITRAEQDPRDIWTEKRIREMVLTPDGKGVNFDVVVEFVEFIAKLEADDTRNYKRPLSRHLHESSAEPAVNPKIPEAEASYALNQYIRVGRRPSTTTSLEVSVACDLCASFLHVAGGILTSKPVFPTTVSILKMICKKVIGYSDFVCEGTIDMFTDVGAYMTPQITVYPYTICGFALKGCGAPDFPRDLWVIPIPPRISSPPPVQVPPTEDDKLTILFMTDLHIDMRYEPGSAAKCNEPLCCRGDSIPKTTPVPENEKAGYWGDYTMCNQALWTFEDALREANDTHGNEIDLVILNGDLPPHDLWSLSPESNLEAFRIVSKKIEERLPGKPVYFAFGNHDMHPMNCYEFPGDPPEFSDQWLYDGVLDIFTKWVDEGSKAEAERTMKKAGFYTALLKPKLRLIAVNNNYAYLQDYLIWGPGNITDAYGQLQWMVELLSQAEKEGERVIIIGHVVPGDNDCIPSWSWNYYRIIDRFAHVIAGQFFGHVHKDFYTLYYDAETLTQPKHVAFVGPPATMFPLNNIAYRLYDFSADNYTLMNYRQFYVDIGEANASGNNKTMPWKLHYSAKDEYSLPDMSAASWADLAKRMRENETLYNIYRDHWNIDIGETDIACVYECTTDSLCTIYQGLSQVPAEWCERFVPTKDPDVDDPSKRKCSARFAKYPDEE